MENQNNNVTVKVVGALVVGTAIGTILGILFAPDRGSETRRKIWAKGSDLSDALKDKFNELFTEAQNEFEEVKEKANDLMVHGNNKVY